MSIRVVADSGEPVHPGIWVDRLDAFIAALDAVDADDPSDFCEQAWDIWESSAIADPPSKTHPAMLIVLGVRQALASVMASTYRVRADVEDRLTLSDAHAALTEELNAVRRECERWNLEGLPSAAEVRARSTSAATGLHAAAKRSA
ncbi:hypothetical protein ORI20_14200 [Mycobacterium sp. CVI_P3]|uniref:Uncharacterized protein n=1 Tax=Mycobacterium pinniadriaticum TaxID=2994102 RepID=A0ABT3SEB3_9MYCO|nr:hypothetical protein [Mycobacterium pinniadriaticum]MCX2931432.1 hypothetical protein [Mycobacterium pinniadriaticum]MCX2937856.1 hypothetical protein [Mycobacterium pinniadriaticum]